MSKVYNLKYPIICLTEEDLENVTPFIQNEFYNNNSYHFNPLSHLDENCSRSKHDMKMGKHVSFKIIYVAEHLKEKCMDIITKLNAKYPQHLDEQVSDQEDNDFRYGTRIPEIIFKCPACYMEFDKELYWKTMTQN